MKIFKKLTWFIASSAALGLAYSLVIVLSTPTFADGKGTSNKIAKAICYGLVFAGAKAGEKVGCEALASSYCAGSAGEAEAALGGPEDPAADAVAATTVATCEEVVTDVCAIVFTTAVTASSAEQKARRHCKNKLEPKLCEVLTAGFGPC